MVKNIKSSIFALVLLVCAICSSFAGDSYIFKDKLIFKTAIGEIGDNKSIVKIYRGESCGLDLPRKLFINNNFIYIVDGLQNLNIFNKSGKHIRSFKMCDKEPYYGWIEKFMGSNKYFAVSCQSGREYNYDHFLYLYDNKGNLLDFRKMNNNYRLYAMDDDGAIYYETLAEQGPGWKITKEAFIYKCDTVNDFFSHKCNIYIKISPKKDKYILTKGADTYVFSYEYYVNFSQIRILDSNLILVESLIRKTLPPPKNNVYAKLEILNKNGEILFENDLIREYNCSFMKKYCSIDPIINTNMNNKIYFNCIYDNKSYEIHEISVEKK